MKIVPNSPNPTRPTDPNVRPPHTRSEPLPQPPENHHQGESVDFSVAAEDWEEPKMPQGFMSGIADNFRGKASQQDGPFYGNPELQGIHSGTQALTHLQPDPGEGLGKR